MGCAAIARNVSGSGSIPVRHLRSRLEIQSGRIDLLISTGFQPKRTSIQAPWQNGIAERWIGSCRREMLDHIIPLNEGYLLRLLREYVRYHNEDRNHDALNKDAPSGRPLEQRPLPVATIKSWPRVGGLHHRYGWSEAA
jgi:transposase InsO family protein